MAVGTVTNSALVPFLLFFKVRVSYRHAVFCQEFSEVLLLDTVMTTGESKRW